MTTINALAIGYSPTEKTSDCIFSLAVYARGVNLYFIYGRSLEDPDRLLLGSGKQGAFVRLESTRTLDDPKIKKLIDRAVKKQRPTLVLTEAATLWLSRYRQNSAPGARSKAIVLLSSLKVKLPGGIRDEVDSELPTTFVMRSTIKRLTDILVRFRVIRVAQDGNVTIVWRKLKIYPEPEWRRR